MSSGNELSTCGLRAVAAGAFEQRRERDAARGLEVEADDAHVRQRLARAAPTTPANACSTTSAFTEASAQDVDLLRHREPPVERHQHGAEPRAGIEQHEIVGMVGGEDGDAVAAPHPQLRFERACGVRDALRQLGIAERGAGKPDRRLLGRERGVAVDEIG